MHIPERVGRERVLRGAVLAGDTEAWRVLYEESFDGLDRYVRWRCGNLKDLAEEIVQETWLTGVRQIRRFDPDQGSFGGWLRGIAAKILMNQLRKQTIRSRLAGLNGNGLSAGSLPEKECDHAEQSQRVAGALAALPEHYEAVLRAKYLDGLSVADIAFERRETPKAIESLLTRARHAFREVYQHPE